MDITKDIRPMATFRNNPAETMRHPRDTGRPVILTVNGKAAAVIQDPATAHAGEGIRQGLEDLRSGRTRSAKSVFGDLRPTHDMQRLERVILSVDRNHRA